MSKKSGGAEYDSKKAAEDLYWGIKDRFLNVMGLHLSTVADDPLKGSIPYKATNNDFCIFVIALFDDFQVRVTYCPSVGMTTVMQKELLEKAQYQLSVPARDIIHWDATALANSLVSEVNQLFKDFAMLNPDTTPTEIRG